MPVQMSEVRKLCGSKGFPKTVIDAWESEGIATLLPIQRSALEADVLDKASCLVIGPTSCGKTFVGELACAKHALALRPCIYLVPFKALAEEKFAEFQQKYGNPKVGASVVISTADRRLYDRAIMKGDFTIAILTYEKLACLMVTNPGIIKATGAVIIDEIQMLSDESRGAGLELLLTRARQISPEIQLIGLSAVVADLNGFDKWLKAEVIGSDHRPVVLREGVVSHSGDFTYVEWIGTDRTPGSETLHALKGDKAPELAVDLASKLLTASENEQVLLFVSSRQATRLLATSLAAKCKTLPSATKAAQALTELEDSETVQALNQTLARSIAFHNSDLTIDERLAVERGFRTGDIRCVVATSTLSMGVNMPASTVIIAGHLKWSKDSAGKWLEVPLTVAEYRNMAGRAGRYGLRKDDLSRAALVATSPLEQEALFDKYVRGDVAPLVSAFLKQPLDKLLLQTFASKMCNSVDGCFRFLLKTFAAQTAWADEKSQNELKEEIKSSLEYLRENELVTLDKKGHVEPTDLGIVCASSGLLVPTFLAVVSLVKSGNTSPVDVAYTASRNEDTGPDAVGLNRLTTDEYNARTPKFTRLIREACEVETSPLSDAMLDSYGSRAAPYEEARALKFHSTALGFVRGIATRTLENEYGVGGGRCRSIGSNCMWLCDTAVKVAWSLGMTDEAKAYEVLADRFQYGCTEPALLLAQVPQRLHRAERERIIEAGYTSLQTIVDTDATEIARSAKVERRRVVELQNGIMDVIGKSLELERQQLNRLKKIGLPVKPLEELYASRDTMLEQAVENVLAEPVCPLEVRRITSQRDGEADLRIALRSSRNGIAQVTAKDKATDLVGLTKAGWVLQQSPELNPDVFICFGRPDFDRPAIDKAKQHVNMGRNYKLIPISVLAEMYVRFHEKRITAARIADILETETGHITIDRL